MRRPLCLLLVAALCAGCGAASGGNGGQTAIATAYPLAWLVEEIAPQFEVRSLAARGQDPHDLELTPQQRAAVEQSDLAVYVGDIGFQPQVEAAIASATGAVVDASDVIGESDLLTFPAHAGEEPSVDPHIWFDARLLGTLATAVGDAAAEADAARADEYRDNAEQVAAELDTLAEDIDDLLAQCRHQDVVVSHEAYQYLLTPHGLTQHGISGAGGHTEASPQDITRLAAQVEDLGLGAVLSEPVEGRTDAEAVASEAGVDIIDIYSLDIVDEAAARKGFPTLLREQAQAVAAAAECGQ